MDTMTFVGCAIDRMTGSVVYQSRPVTSYKEAHDRAERHAKGDRYSVEVK